MILSGQVSMCDWVVCSLPETFVQGDGLATVLLEVSSVSRPEENNELVERNFTDAESKSSLLFYVAESEGHWTGGQKV